MKKKRLLKTLSFSSLAVLMAAAGTFAFAPLGASPNTLANENQTEMTTSGGLGLDPKNDPVVYTTESGLEIKKSNGKHATTNTVITNRGYSYTQDLTSFYYFTMGTFSGTIYTAKTISDTYTVNNEPVNWLIIGRGDFLFTENMTPAGSSINSLNSKQEIALLQNYLPMSMSTIPQSSDIPDNCFLALSEKLLGNMYFNSSGALNQNLYTLNAEAYFVHGSTVMGNRYRYYGDRSASMSYSDARMQSWTIAENKGGDLYNYNNNLFSKNVLTGMIEGENRLGFSQENADMIMPQQLYTYYSNGTGYNYAETPLTDGGTYYSLFPLAVRAAHNSTKQNFCIEDYLKSTSQMHACFIGSNDLCYQWDLRSGSPAERNANYAFVPGKNLQAGSGTNNSSGVRPAFVIKIME